MDVNGIHAISRAIADNDLELAAELRDALYSRHPHHSRLELDLAITNDLLDIVAPTNGPAPDAHLDDVGD